MKKSKKLVDSVPARKIEHYGDLPHHLTLTASGPMMDDRAVISV